MLIVPAVVRRTPAGLLGPILVVLVVIAAASLAAWLVGARLHGRARTAAGWCLVALAGGTLLVVTATAIPDDPAHALPLAAGVAITVSPARRAALRVPFQATLVVGMGVLLVMARRPAIEVGVALFLLVFVIWVAGLLARSLTDARQRRLAAGQAAERRAELLAVVRDLSGANPTEAARTAVTSLRSLGFSVAGVSVERGGVLVPLALEGVPLAPELEIGQGLAGSAVAEDRVIVAEDYANDPRRLQRREGLGAAIAVPIRSGGVPVGVVLGGHDQPGPLPEAVVEVAEVLADHLGGVLETEQRLDRQRELLARMQALDVMRERLVTEVSEEVRDPLTAVRGIAETLVTHGERLPAAQRQRLLEAFVTQARALRTTIDALLDFSRLQAARPLPTLAVTRVGDPVLAAVGSTPVEGDLDALVRTDPMLLTRALETIRTAGAIRQVSISAGDQQVRLRMAVALAISVPRSRLLLRLAERLVLTVGGDWEHDRGHIEIRLPRGEVGFAGVPS